MFQVALFTGTLGLLLLDLVSRVLQCKYSVDGLVRTAQERSSGSACQFERHLYEGAMRPSCSDYEAQLQFGWQVSYTAQCLLNSYNFIQSWWFFTTVLLIVGYVVKLSLANYFTPPPPPPPIMYPVYLPPVGRGLSIGPPVDMAVVRQRIKEN